jgi:hypothetical protein
MLVLGPLFFVQEKGIFGLDVSNFIIEPQKIMLQIFELEEFFFERGNDCVFVVGLSLIEQSSCSEVSVHLPMEFD